VPAFSVKLTEYIARLREQEQSVVAAKALTFALLTASRTNEVLNATWDEINEDDAVWIVPGQRMKAAEPHTAYLSRPALAILKEMRAATGGSGLVFPSPFDPERPLSDMTMLMVLRRMKTGRMLDDDTAETVGHLTTVHGLCRATFSSWAYGEYRKVMPDAIEASLAHKEADHTARAYNHQKDKAETFEQERRRLLEAWGRYVTTPPRSKATADNVVPMKRKSA
jgi:integrase